MASATDDYDWADDHGKNIEFAYAFIRERVAKGGKGWREYPMNGWQPIETAPKDKFILVWDPNIMGVHVAIWNWTLPPSGDWQNDAEQDSGIEASHWMPLPEPPK